ncbi:dihydrolipoamide acetyltransferase family protein [Streptomyces sp. Inha503]|uniref:dihydrolipoamide acetyltransferase family protein n=1 Tax=Streptomyces sp. Inha503 TaxID=3383314 RepID=UPI0039A07A98
MTTAPERRVFTLPDLGEGLTEAEVVAWRVAVGSTVDVDQVVVEVETAKATVEVPVPYAGTVLELHADVGAVLAVGAPLISVGRVAPSGAARGEPPARQDDGEHHGTGSGHVLVGYGTDHAPAGRRRRARSAAVPSGRTGPTGGAPAQAERPDGAGRAAAPLVISPLVRSLARKHGVDVARLSPSGPHGIVLRRDVEQAMAQAAQPATADTPAAQAPDSVMRIPLKGRLRTAAEKLSRSGAAPCVTTWVDVDATGLLRMRENLRASEPGQHIGLMALLARICVVGLSRFPELNSTVDEERGEIVRFSGIGLGFAAQTERGLVVPVVRDAHRMTMAELAAELTRLTGEARSGGLRPQALTGGTFTLNNYGVFGVDGSTPLLNHPEAAMLGVGRIADKPWAVDGRLAVRKVTQLSLTFDHRVCDGGTAGGFLRYVADCVKRPANLPAEP